MDLRKQFTLEHGIYLLILLAAGLLRFWNLADLPLTEVEAHSAFSAHQIAVGEGLISANFQAGYTLLTSALFMMFGSSEFLARLVPAILGSLLVLFPALFRKPLGRTTALMLASGLAIDPLMIFLSRRVGGGMLAIFAVSGLFAALYYRKPIIAGIFAGLAVLGAPFSIVGLVGFAAIWLIVKLTRFDAGIELEDFGSDALRNFLITTGITVLGLGTAFLTQPDGLAWIGADIWAYLQGWLGGGVPIWQMVVAQPAYLILPLFFGLSAAICSISTRNQKGIILSFAALILFVLIMIYPGKQVADLAWLGLLLWILSAVEINRVLQTKIEKSPVFIFQFVLITVAGIFLYLNMASFTRIILEIKHHLTVIGIIAFMVISTVLVMFSWSRKDALKGFSSAVLVLLAVFTINAGLQGNTKAERFVNEIWHDGPVILNASLVKDTLENISLLSSGINDEIETFYKVDSLAFHWLLRNMPNARYISQFNAAAFPEILFTPILEEEPFLAAAYRGQSFGWQVHSTGTFAIQQNVYDWLLYRDSKPVADELILWARVDLFPDGEIINNDLPSLDYEPIPEDEGEFGPLIE